MKKTLQEITVSRNTGPQCLYKGTRYIFLLCSYLYDLDMKKTLQEITVSRNTGPQCLYKGARYIVYCVHIYMTST